eukprot:COSAG04_NODE_22191_length_359_cov_0.984615_1_plen_84_part_01
MIWHGIASKGGGVHANKEGLRKIPERIAAPTRTQVIPPVLSLFTLLKTVSRPFFTRFFPFLARFHRLAEAVPTSPKPEPRAKKP